jgi:hypothetical protein
MSTALQVVKGGDEIDPSLLPYIQKYASLLPAVFTLLSKLSTFDGSTTRREGKGFRSGHASCWQRYLPAGFIQARFPLA